MGDVDLSIIAQRFSSLRKHLGERLNSKLSIQDLAEKTGIPEYKMVRLEHGKGTMDSLVVLLLFYRSHSYNLDWILFPENNGISMMLSSSDDLLRISEMVKMLSNRLQADYTQITSQLKEMGYAPLDDKFSPSGTGMAEVPLTFDLS